MFAMFLICLIYNMICITIFLNSTPTYKIPSYLDIDVYMIVYSSIFVLFLWIEATQ